MVVVVGVVGDALFILSIGDGDGHRAEQHSVDDLGNTVKSATFKKEGEFIDTVRESERVKERMSINMDWTHCIDSCPHRLHLH